jgi:glutamate dehydrogenase/leucine dehydrogenase
MTDFRHLPQFDNHEMLISVSDDTIGLKGAIGIHNTNLGPALGGTRFQVYASEEDAIRDALNLSRAMSYKCALAGLSYGGGKAVIITDESLSKPELLKRYAQLVDKLGGLFKTGTDVGLSDADVAYMAEYTGHMLGVKAAARGDMSTAKVAALGVFYSCKAALQHIYGSDSFEGRTLGIKGVGKLGGELARLASAEGARVFIADIDGKRCEELADSISGLEVVSVEEAPYLPVDIYAPCALGNEFTSENIAGLRCRIISGGANNQLSDSRVGDELYKNGILYCPDYIVNAGGLIYVSDELEEDGFSKERVEERTAGIRTTLTNIFERSKAENLPTHTVADKIARERIGQAS